MGILGTKNEEVNLFEPNAFEKTYYFKSSKTTVRVDNKFIRIARGGASNAILQGLDGEKSILLSQITAYQLKKPGITVGYLQIIYPGSQDNKGGIFDAVKDENSITFSKNEKDIIVEIKREIESRIK
jgi:hypothetical protein